VAAALNRIHAHYRDAALDLPALAAAAGLSLHHFGRVFRAATGSSPMHYLQQVRLRQARALLETTTLRVKEVAHEVGFGDPLHFSRAFRAAHGHSPRQHRGQQHQ
jgi:transcriptional regulator GlxA family with amidase domain